MAVVVTSYRDTNPGTGTRIFDIDMAATDTTSGARTHNCGWTPDSYYWEMTDQQAPFAQALGGWMVTVTSTTFTVTKENVAGTGGSIRLALCHNAVRP